MSYGSTELREIIAFAAAFLITSLVVFRVLTALLHRRQRKPSATNVVSLAKAQQSARWRPQYAGRCARFAVFWGKVPSIQPSSPPRNASSTRAGGAVQKRMLSC